VIAAMTGCGSTVMIVEDDIDVREMLAEIVAEGGYRALSAANGREALDTLRATPARPCLILLDMMMPVMDGRQFRAAQATDPELGDIPVVVLSAQVDVRETASTLKAAGFLEKPVDLHALLAVIAQHC
jgi:CheY-like chemotaxis protein